MATIVTGNQGGGYGPLLQQLASAFLTPLASHLSDQLFNSGRREKELALAKWGGEMLSGQETQQLPQTSQPTLDYSMSTPLLDKLKQAVPGEQAPFSAGGQTPPVDGWQNAMQPFSMLGQFDQAVNGSTRAAPSLPGQGAMPLAGGGGGAPVTYSDLLANLDTKRFRALDMETVYRILGGVYEDYQGNMQRRKVQDFLFNNSFDSGNMNQLLQLLSIGGIDSAALGHMATYNTNRYEHDNPHKTFNPLNTGGSILGLSFDPRSGNTAETGRYDVTMAPYERARIGLGYAEEAGRNRRSASNRAAADRASDWYSVVDERNEQVFVNKRTGEIRRTGLRVAGRGDGKDPFLDYEIDALDADIESSKEEILALRRNEDMNEAPKNSQIAALEANISEARKKRAELISNARGGRSSNDKLVSKYFGEPSSGLLSGNVPWERLYPPSSGYNLNSGWDRQANTNEAKMSDDDIVHIMNRTGMSREEVEAALKLQKLY